MRNPGLRLVGLTTSPGGGGVFGTRAEEELRHWLESRLDALGIDPVAYSRFVLSLLRRPPDSALSPLDEDIDFAVVNRPAGGGGAGAGGRRHHHRVRPRARISGDRDQRRAVVQCLTNAADQKCGVEPLVDELCAKLRNLEGSSGSTNDTSDTETEESKRKNLESVNNSKFETLTPRDKALRYYAAFPALQPATPKKNNNYNHNNNIINNNNNNNNNYNNNNYNINKNNNNLKKDKTYSATINNLNKKNYNNKNKKNDKKRKTKMSIRTIDHKKDKGTFGFAKSMERERDNDRESEMDKIKLQELQAKFDHSLEALWDSGPGNAGDKASIWAAPSLSIPSGPLWPVDPTELLILPIIHDDDDDNDEDEDDDDVINDEDSSINCKKIINSCNNTPYFYNNHYHVSDDGTIADNETVIPWDIGIIGVGKFIDDSKDKIDYNLNWSDYGGDGPWNWKDLGNNLITIDNPKINSFYSSPHDDINLVIKQQRQQKEQEQYLSANNDYKEKLNNLKNEIDGNKIINNDGGNFVELKLKNEQEQKQEVEAKVVEVIEDKEQVKIEVKNKASENVKVEQSEVEEEEDLLTSARTHFRPIKDDGNWVDGTTFPVNNNYESVNYRRSSCGNLLYLPNDDNPYMEYHETIIAPLSSSSASNTSTAAGDGTPVRNFTLKFRVKQCDKSIQTDPIRSPVKRRIIAEPDRHFYYTKLINNLGDDDNGDSHADDDDDDDDDDNVNILTQESYDINKDSFMLDHMHWKQPSLSLLNDRKRRHSSSFNCRPLAALRPLTL